MMQEHLQILLFSIMSDVLPTVGDLGAGGGHYSTWLNETGLVRAYAFDGIPEIEEVMPEKFTK
jgi:hypothetical protein